MEHLPLPLVTIKLSALFERPVPLETFGHVMPEWARILDAFAAEYAPAANPEWDIVRLEVGSAELGVRPRLSAEDALLSLPPEFGDEYETMSRALVDAFTSVEEGGDPADVMPEAAVVPFGRLSRAFGDSVVSIAISTPYSATEITSAVMVEPEDRPARLASIGTVDGIIQGVFFGGRRPYFQVRSRRSTTLIKCFFDEKRLYSAVMDNMRKRVELRGRLMRDLDGVITRVEEVRFLRPVPGDDELPALSDLAGLVPDLSDGLPSEEWIRSQRSGQ